LVKSTIQPLKIDEFGLRILRELQEDGRISVLDLAKRVSLSPTPCARRLAQLVEGGVVEGFGARVSPKAVGLSVEVMVEVKLERHANAIPEDFRRRVLEREEVVACFAMTGDTDYLLHVMVPDIDSLNRFLMEELLKIDGVRDVRSSLVLEAVKRQQTVPTGHLR
jgi:Lrp/AsnC family leucine-responsive transcriptional regulator